MNISAATLPHGLLDLTLFRAIAMPPGSLRAAVRTGRCLQRTGLQSRRMHQAALATAPPPPPQQMEHFDVPQVQNAGGRRRRSRGTLGVRTSLDKREPGFELEKRIQALDVAVAEEESSITPPFYSEEDLMLFYEDLLAIQPKPVPSRVDLEALERQQAEQDKVTVQEAEQRLLQTYSNVPAQSLNETPHMVQGNSQPHHSVLVHAEAVVRELEAMRGLAMTGFEGQAIASPSIISVPISVLSVKECEALVRICMKAQDGPSALLALEIMKRSGMPIPENAVTDTLEILASTGNVNATESLVANFISKPTERQRHLHVKAHLKATSPEVIPTSALTVLHGYEEKALFAPMQTYTSCITTLFSTPSSVARAQAWDLFTHMRYVAHPDPDVVLYTLMIRACASPLASSRTSEPEKALDFWTEMTVDHKIEPTVGAYNAVILACARSGSKVYVNEAYRLAKQMLDAHRDARGVSAFQPDKKTFCALLEGAKRIGDLGRARWILAEMVRAGGGVSGEDVNGPVGVGVDEEVMMHLFQAYAVYQPPFKREATVVVSEDKEPQNGSMASAQSTSSGSENAEREPTDSKDSKALAHDSLPSFSHIPPQSHEEVLQEVTFLFQRILNDTGILPLSPQHPYQQEASAHLVNKFSNVQLTSRLLGSYISVFFRHAPLDLAQRMYWKIFDQLKVQRTARIRIEALERCAYAKKGSDREVALRFGEDVWKEWKAVEESGWDGDKRLSARFIERAYAAKLRLFAVVDDVEKALELLQYFVRRYPPSSIRKPSEKLYLRSTRTVLTAPRPLVRMTTTVDVPDDGVPPLLTFDDLEVLHHRLVAFEMHKEVGYVKWVAKAYEWMLRVRRDEGFRAKALKEEVPLEKEV